MLDANSSWLFLSHLDNEPLPGAKSHCLGSDTHVSLSCYAVLACYKIWHTFISNTTMLIKIRTIQHDASYNGYYTYHISKTSSRKYAWHSMNTSKYCNFMIEVTWLYFLWRLQEKERAPAKIFSCVFVHWERPSQRLIESLKARISFE